MHSNDVHVVTDTPQRGTLAGGFEEQTPRECEGMCYPLKSKGREKRDVEEKIKVFISSGN